MVTPLDVFTLKNDGEPQWLGCAETLSEAIKHLREEGLGSYFIFSQQTGHKTFYEVNAEGVVSEVDASMGQR